MLPGEGGGAGGGAGGVALSAIMPLNNCAFDNEDGFMQCTK